MFEGRVAHGYYILSKAAGLFVEPRKGPVLLNAASTIVGSPSPCTQAPPLGSN